MPLSGPSAAALYGGVDLVLGRLLLQLHDQVGDRAVHHRHPHRDAVELALELGQHERGGLRRAGGGGDDVLRGSPRPAQVLVREVKDDLVIGVGVDRGHQALADAEGVVQHLGHRRDAVRRAGRVGDDVVLRGVVLVVVDAHHDRDVLAGGRRRDNDLPGAAGQMLGRVGSLREPAGRLDHHIHAEVAPRQRGRVALGQHLDRVVPGPDDVAVRRHVQVERAEQGVVLEQVRTGGEVAQVVSRDDLDVGVAGVHRAPEVTTDTAKTIDSHPDSHCMLLHPAVSCPARGFAGEVVAPT